MPGGFCGRGSNNLSLVWTFWLAISSVWMSPAAACCQRHTAHTASFSAPPSLQLSTEPWTPVDDIQAAVKTGTASASSLTMIVGKSSSILIDCNFCLIKRNIDFQLILQQSLMSLFLIQPSPPLPPYTVLLLFLQPLPLRSISITSTMTTPSTPPSPAFAAVATTPYTECLLKDC